MSTGTGTNVSKGVGYAVLDNPAGENVSKALAYAILDVPPGINVSKVVAYAVLEPVNSNPPVWPSFTFANGMVGLAFSQQWDMSPAASPLTVTLETGSLPPGIAITNPGATLFALAGTPTAAGLYSFRLKATNTYGGQSADFTMTVTASGGNYGFVA